MNSEDNEFTNLAALNIQEADRQRIARDLHDTSLQNLTHLVHKIELSSLYIDKDPLQAKLELALVSKSLRSVIEEIRNTIFDLRPMSFDDLGLKAAIERLLDVINEGRQFSMDIRIDDVSCENDMVLVNIYRVIHESLTNILKHAQADSILLHCCLIDGHYQIDIEDDGIGFEIDAVRDKGDRHFGLSLIRERIRLLDGSIQINSILNEGTKIHIDIPLNK